MIALLSRLLFSRAAGPLAGAAAVGLAVMLAGSQLEVGRLQHRIAASEAGEHQAADLVEAARAHQAEQARQIETLAAARARSIRQATQTLAQEADVHVSQSANDRCIVPLGLVRLHDAAASGDLSAVPDPAGLPDDAAAGITLSNVGRAVVENYGAAHENAEQLRALQAWVRSAADTSR